MLKSKKNAAYIIAEVGQNHQGDFELAKEYILKFSERGADAIKFQKRDNKNLFSKNKFNQLYENQNSFGKTYGLHREELEFNIEQMTALKQMCEDCEVDFICTPFDEKSLEQLLVIDTKILKIASFDMGNLRLISEILKNNVKLILSAGGSNIEIVKKTIEFVLNFSNKITLLHCVSNYPALPNELQLHKIQDYKNLFSKIQIGLSDHFNGPLSGPVGFLYGAEVFEKHVKFNRSWKGTDHSFALSLSGFEQFVKDINRTNLMGLKNKNSEDRIGKEFVFTKLGKSLIAEKTIKKNEIFSINNLSGKIFVENGIPVRQMVNLIGKKSKNDYDIGALIKDEEME